jgi:hypothetical protein
LVSIPIESSIAGGQNWKQQPYPSAQIVSITLNGQELQNLWNVAYWEAGTKNSCDMISRTF